MMFHFIGSGNFVVDRGVILLVEKSHGDFIAEYVGELITTKEGERREDDSASTYRFFFTKEWWCVMIAILLDCLSCLYSVQCILL
jgi:hypothetical protein